VDQNHSRRVSTQWTTLRKRSDRCGVGADRRENASKTATWAATGSRSTRGRTGDFLHSVHRLPVASITERVPAILNCPELFLRLAGHRQVAQNRQSPGTASKTKARTQAHADCGYHRQPKCFNDAGRRPSRL